MTDMLNQRWRDGDARWRPAGEVIQTSRYEVALIDGDAAAKAFVQQHHYSGTYPAARVRMGLYRGADLVGVAVFSVPANNRVIPSYLPHLDPLEGVELGRFVLLDDVPGNGETWFLARCFELLRQAKPELRGVLSYSDPVPRRDESGQVILPGHIGTIYQAHNARYMGRSGARTQIIDRHGRILSPRAISKVRAGEVGQDYALAQIIEATGLKPKRHEVMRDYITRATAHLRRVRHPGNHAYIWSLDKRTKIKANPTTYPKRVDLAYYEQDAQGLIL